MVAQNLSMALREEVLDCELRCRISSICLRNHGRGVAEIILEARLVQHARLLNLLTLHLILLHSILLSDDLCLVQRAILRTVTNRLHYGDRSVVFAWLLGLLKLRIIGIRLEMKFLLSELRCLLHRRISTYLGSLLRNVEGSHLVNRQRLVANNLRRVDW